MAWKGALYSLTEDLEIIHYIINGNYGHFHKGDNIWKQLERENIVPGRSWLSLRNRWLKTIIFDLERQEYHLTLKEITALKKSMGERQKRRTQKIKRRQ